MLHTGFGAKAIAILRCIEVSGEERTRRLRDVCEQYSTKSVAIKTAELAERGYITAGSIKESLLTEKGRAALEKHPMDQ